VIRDARTEQPFCGIRAGFTGEKSEVARTFSGLKHYEGQGYKLKSQAVKK
jgi:hypothetical protein